MRSSLIAVSSAVPIRANRSADMPALDGEASRNGRECWVDLVWAKPSSAVNASTTQSTKGSDRDDMQATLTNRVPGGKPAISARRNGATGVRRGLLDEARLPSHPGPLRWERGVAHGSRRFKWGSPSIESVCQLFPLLGERVRVRGTAQRLSTKVTASSQRLPREPFNSSCCRAGGRASPRCRQTSAGSRPATRTRRRRRVGACVCAPRAAAARAGDRAMAC